MGPYLFLAFLGRFCGTGDHLEMVYKGYRRIPDYIRVNTGDEILVAQWYLLPFSWSRFPIKTSQEQEGYPYQNRFSEPPRYS